MIINIPVDVEKIISRLEKNGFEAYAVGGCVRDSLMGKVPSDWDICTSARPEQVRACFEGYPILEIGMKHGTVILRMNDQSYEVTTYRKDGEYLDSRRPESVQFVTSLQEDLARRDFTINAMAYNSAVGLIDCYHGCEDLRNGIIRCVGNADKRLAEDALRIIRALRFASVLDFSIETETAKGLNKNKKLLNHISKERIHEELCKLLCGRSIKEVLQTYSDIMAVIIPELIPMIGFEQNNPHHRYDVWQHTLTALEHCEEDLITRTAVLLHDVGKPGCYTDGKDGVGHFYGHGEFGARMAEEILKDLKFDNRTVSAVCQLIKYHDADIHESNEFIKKWLHKIGEVQLKRLLQVKYADVMGQSDYLREHKLKKLEALNRIMNQVLEEKQCFSLKELKISGKDLIKLGVDDGRKIGQILENLLDQVMEDRIENKRDILLSAAKNMR